MRNYKTKPTRRPVKRFHVEVPYQTDPPPNSDYWKEKANDRLVELMDAVGEEKARAMTEHITGTWHEINDQIRDLIKYRF